MTYGANKLFNDTAESVISDAIATDEESSVLNELDGFIGKADLFYARGVAFFIFKARLRHSSIHKPMLPSS